MTVKFRSTEDHASYDAIRILRRGKKVSVEIHAKRQLEAIAWRKVLAQMACRGEFNFLFRGGLVRR